MEVKDSPLRTEHKGDPSYNSPKVTRRSISAKLSTTPSACLAATGVENKDGQTIAEQHHNDREKVENGFHSIKNKTLDVGGGGKRNVAVDSDGFDGDENVSVDASERRKRRKTKSKYNNAMENDDLEKMLKWKNGVGHLSGSNLKFRKSNMGALEVMTPSSDEEELEGGDPEFDGKAKRNNKRGGARKKDTNSPLMSESTPLASPQAIKKESINMLLEPEKQNRKERKKKRFAEDELLKCETCGCYGLISEFRSSGRFCSQRCVGAYASKKRAQMIQQQIENGERLIAKSIKKHNNSGPKSIRKKRLQVKGSPSSTTKGHASSKCKQLAKVHMVQDDSTLYYRQVSEGTKFNWETYLKITKKTMVPPESFYKEYDEQELIPFNAGQFKVGMKLECVDPKHQSCFCVCTVVEVQGARMRLNFDGWSPNYDFWINTNSFFLHPCGWCERNGQKIQPPKGMKHEDFSWPSYLKLTEAEAAPEHAFYVPPPVGRHNFRTCMKLEAIDRKNPDLVCVSSVNNVIGDQFLIHFDEWDDQYDYWCREDSPYIHPMGWCQTNGIPLVPPTDDMVGKFVWEDYLTDTTCIAAPPDIFKQRKELVFEIGKKLEAIDPRNPALCRVATICDKDDFRIKLHFDGWDLIYDYWFDMDSVDIHPVTWCERTGHTLETPPCERDPEPPCGTPGCRGVGHIKGAKYTTHHTTFGCPYTMQNMNRSTSPVIDRLAVNEEIAATPSITKTPVEEVYPDSTTKTDNVKPKGGKSSQKKKLGKMMGVRKRKRRGSNEVSSSTNPGDESLCNYDSYKKIPSTHIPAGKTNRLNEGVYKSCAIPWTSVDVAVFLKKIGYEEHVPSFQDNQIDGQALLLLSQADLVRHLKLKLGPALKIYSEISKL